MEIAKFIEGIFKSPSRELEEKVCLWLAQDLRRLEELTGKDFYTAKEKNRKQRPFLSAWCTGDTFAVVFLTASPRGYQKKVNLKRCITTGCKGFSFYDEVYLFRTPKGKYEAVFLNRVQMEELATLCGCCENLERIKKFCSQLEGKK